MRRILVVGGSVAAVNAVDALRREGYAGELSLVSAEECLPYDRPPLSKEALREGHEHIRLAIKPLDWYVERDIDLHLGAAAVRLDPQARTVRLVDGRELSYDGAIIATGCRARTVPFLQGVPRVHQVRTLADSLALHGRLVPSRHLVVIGAGFIGLEVAATARRMGLDVSVVELAPVPLTRVLGAEAGRWFRDYHAEHGVDVHCGTAVDRVRLSDGSTVVHLSDGTELKADLIVAGVGVVPDTDWLRGSGVDLADGILCDPTLKTSLPDVAAAGDVARWNNRLFSESMRVEQWLNAVEQGAHAAKTLLGGREAFASVPYFWSDQFDAKVKFVGWAAATDDVVITQTGDTSVVAVFGRRGRLRGALCINAPRHLARLKRGIEAGMSWTEAVGT